MQLISNLSVQLKEGQDILSDVLKVLSYDVGSYVFRTLELEELTVKEFNLANFETLKGLIIISEEVPFDVSFSKDNSDNWLFTQLYTYQRFLYVEELAGENSMAIKSKEDGVVKLLVVGAETS
jgi:hypothetical protein